MRRVPAWVFGLMVAVALLLPRTGAASQTVVLVLAGGSQQELAPVEQGLRSELLAADFAVTSVQVPAVPDAESLHQTANGMLTKAAIAVIRSDSAISGFVWAKAKDDERTLVRHIQPVAWSDEAASVFAIRATELLNAMLIELGYPKRQPPQVEEPPPEPAPPEPPAPEPPPKPEPEPPAKPPPAPPPRPSEPDEPAWSVAMGGAAVGGPGGIPVGGAIVLGLSRRLGRSLRASILLAGPALGNVSSDAGDSSVDQELGVLRLGWEFMPLPWLGAYAVVGIGAHRLGVSGEARPPHRGNTDQVLSALGTVGLGARFDLGQSFSVVVEGDAGATIPRGKVVFLQRTVARTGQPLLLGGAAIEYAW